jgi:hypothetical protein
MDCLCCLFHSKPSIIIDKTNTSSPTCLIKKSPSQRFGHISPEIMKRLDPLGKVPVFNPECELSMATYKTYQNGVIDRLMGFDKEQKN